MKSHIVIVLLWSCKDLICCPKAAQLPHGYLINEKIKVTPLKFSGSLAFADFMVWSSFFFFVLFFLFSRGAECTIHCQNSLLLLKMPTEAPLAGMRYIFSSSLGKKLLSCATNSSEPYGKSSIPKREEKIISHSMDCDPSLPFLSPKSQMVQIQTFYLYKL